MKQPSLAANYQEIKRQTWQVACELSVVLLFMCLLALLTSTGLGRALGLPPTQRGMELARALLFTTIPLVPLTQCTLSRRSPVNGVVPVSVLACLIFGYCWLSPLGLTREQFRMDVALGIGEVLLGMTWGWLIWRKRRLRASLILLLFGILLLPLLTLLPALEARVEGKWIWATCNPLVATITKSQALWWLPYALSVVPLIAYLADAKLIGPSRRPHVCVVLLCAFSFTGSSLAQSRAELLSTPQPNAWNALLISVDRDEPIEIRIGDDLVLNLHAKKGTVALPFFMKESLHGIEVSLRDGSVSKVDLHASRTSRVVNFKDWAHLQADALLAFDIMLVDQQDWESKQAELQNYAAFGGVVVVASQENSAGDGALLQETLGLNGTREFSGWGAICRVQGDLGLVQTALLSRAGSGELKDTLKRFDLSAKGNPIGSPLDTRIEALRSPALFADQDVASLLSAEHRWVSLAIVSLALGTLLLLPRLRKRRDKSLLFVVVGAGLSLATIPFTSSHPLPRDLEMHLYRGESTKTLAVNWLATAPNLHRSFDLMGTFPLLHPLRGKAVLQEKEDGSYTLRLEAGSLVKLFAVGDALEPYTPTLKIDAATLTSPSTNSTTRYPALPSLPGNAPQRFFQALAEDLAFAGRRWDAVWRLAANPDEKRFGPRHLEECFIRELAPEESSK